VPCSGRTARGCSGSRAEPAIRSACPRGCDGEVRAGDGRSKSLGGNSGGRLACDLVVDVLPVQLPHGLTARPIAPDDVPAIAAMLAAAEAVDRTGVHESAEDLTGWWVNDLVDLARDSTLVSTADGELVGYAAAIAPPTFRDAFDVYLEGRVHPRWRGRGVGRALLAWQLERGAQVHAERHPEAPARLTVSAYTSMPDLAALLRRAGLAEARWFAHMSRPLTELPEPRAVEGVELVPFSWDRDEEVRRAHNAAFTEHYGSSERDAASWQVMFTGRQAFRPDLSVLALEDGAVVAYTLAYVHEGQTAALGERETYFGQIGVLPQARGRGLSKATIVQALRAAAEHDCQLASLQVDNDNSSGALRLYESLGFTTTHTEVSWTRDVPPRA
jgi:mycothiol synthase